MPFKLISTAGTQSFELREGATLLVGRAPGCGIPLFDPTISRRHAELSCSGTAVLVRDLGSSNGTFVNGARLRAAETAEAQAGDVVAFGQVPFRVAPSTATAGAATAGPTLPATPVSTPTIVLQRSVQDPAGPLTTVYRAATLAEAKARSEAAAEHEQTEKKLALLLEVSKGLSRAVDIDALLETIVEMVFEILNVDRVAIELLDEHGERIPKLSRDRDGTAAPRSIPRSIARKVLDEKVAILSANTPADERFGGSSIVAQRVRSAMCAPLIGSDDTVQGVLYVDNRTAPQRFDDGDLDFLVAFSNIAAVAIENSRLAERVRREALVRSNFERFFAPSLAARIAQSPEAVRLGGEKHTVAVLFCDIRGFTAIAEAMGPEDVARLLNAYYAAMAEVVFHHGGTLDKFLGDAVMAQWGAPIPAPDGADRAMRAALDMMHELEMLNATWHAGGRPRLQIGVGLNYGETFAGYVGSEHRLEYTVIGDAVNTASRLCAAADGGEILLTGEMRAALSAPPPLRERGTIELRGKSQPVPIYSVIR